MRCSPSAKADESVTGAAALSLRLRDATKEDHVAAERSPFMGRLLRGQAARQEYSAYLASLLPVYVALEETLPTMPEWVRDLHPSALLRQASLVADLRALSNADGPPAPVPSAVGLADRVREMAERPGPWVAHAWVRYMGDLSGGQVLARIVARSYGLADDVGTAFYRFPEISDGDAFKATYRDGLDRAPLIEAEVGAAVEEARAAFATHRRIFAELEGLETL